MGVDFGAVGCFGFGWVGGVWEGEGGVDELIGERDLRKGRERDFGNIRNCYN